jgi:putative polyhydroxyalkanoate system protein
MIALHRHHRLGLASAKRLAETMARRLQADYGGSYTWQGNDLQFRRPGASGRVTVTKDSVQIRIDLGLLLSPLQSRIEREVRAFFDEHLGEEARPRKRKRR